MKLYLLDTKEILDFEEEIGFDLVVRERENPELVRYYANFEFCDVKEEHALIGEFGNGQTIDEAIQDYCNCISNKTLVFNAYTPKRKEIKAPKLIHTRLVEPK